MKTLRTLGLASALALAGCGTTTTGGTGTTTPVVTAPTQQQIQQDTQTAIYFLQAFGCVLSEASGVAAPIVSIESDTQGNQVLKAVGAGGQLLCQGVIPPTAMPAPVAPGAPPITTTAPSTAFRRR